jgi:signal transduction histidine kinase
MTLLVSRRPRQESSSGEPSRAFRLFWVLLALVLPLVWGYLTVLRFPSDGTVIYASSSFQEADRWSDTHGVILADAHGDGALPDLVDRAHERDPKLVVRVYAVEGRSLRGRPDIVPASSRKVGNHLQYGVSIGGKDQGQVDVTLTRYPVLGVAAANPGAILLWWGLAFAGCFVFWRRPRDSAARAFLALGALVPAGMTAFPVGLQVIDFVDGGGVWTYLAGDLANCLVWGTILLLTLEFPRPVQPFLRRPWLRLAPFVVPFALYGLRVAFDAGRLQGLARLEGLILPSSTMALVGTPVIAGIFLVRMLQPSMSREDKLAIRIVLTSVLASVLGYFVLSQVPQLVGGGPQVSLWLQPFALFFMLVGAAVAILRYRVFEVDVIVRRSLLLVVTVTAVVLAFLGLAWLLAKIGLAGDRLPVVLGGLLAVVLIGVGRWLRQRLNRLVFGARDDSYRVVSELRGVGSSVSTEEALTEALSTLARTLRLGYAAIEVNNGDSKDHLAVSVGQQDGPPTVVELKHHGQPWGTLSLGVSRGRESFGPRDRRLLDDVGSQLGALVASLVMNQDLRRSRERIITAREEERRRIRRDLHDGLGPTLAGQMMELQFVRDRLRDDPDQVEDVLEHMLGEVRKAITDIRALVDDLRPRILDQFGLVSALQQHAAGSALSRSGEGDTGPVMRWSVSAGDVEPLPAAVEVAAYRIVLEAVNNAAKHSAASHCRVELTRADGNLVIRVSDNGRGFPEKAGVGVGLGSMRERAEELGGTFELSSERNRGTTIVIQLPLPVS